MNPPYGRFVCVALLRRVVGNASKSGSDADVRSLVVAGAIPPLCDLLAVTTPARLSILALEALECILRVGARMATEEDGNSSDCNNLAKSCANEFARQVSECGGVDKLRKLSEHQSQQVRNKAEEIRAQYC